MLSGTLPNFSPCFPGELVGCGFLFEKGQLPQGSFPQGLQLAQAAARAGLLGNLTQFWGKQATVLECHRPNSQASHF